MEEKTNNLIHDLKLLIGSNDIDIVISKLESIFNFESSEFDSLQLIRATYLSLKTENIRGNLSYDEYSRQLAKLRDSLLALIKGLPSHFTSKRI